MPAMTITAQNGNTHTLSAATSTSRDDLVTPNSLKAWETAIAWTADGKATIPNPKNSNEYILRGRHQFNALTNPQMTPTTATGRERIHVFIHTSESNSRA